MKIPICLNVIFTFIISLSANGGTQPLSLEQLPLQVLYPQTKFKQTIRVKKSVKSVTQKNFQNAYFSLLPVLHSRGVSLEKWFREDHIVYFSDYLNSREKNAMVLIFSKILHRVIAGDRDLTQILAGLDNQALVAKVDRLETEILRMKDQHKEIIRFAVNKHENQFQQMYGDLPYSFHLRQVRSVLKRFGFGPKDSLMGLKLGTAAWLHDIIEDTDVTYEQLVEAYGAEIADIVQGVTKLDKEGLTKLDRIQQTYLRTRMNKGSRILKVADRIANVEEGIVDLFSGRPSKVHKYFDEWSLFKEILYVPGDADQMWIHLERLLNDSDYAQSFAMRALHKNNEKSDVILLCKQLF